MIRSVLAIVAGFLFIFVLSMGADWVLMSILPSAFDAFGRTDSVPVLLLVTGYVAVIAVAGSYLTARLAPSRPMRHALVLGGLGLVFRIPATIALWDTAPAWFHVVGLLLVMPYAWIGGRLREAELARRGETRGAAAPAF